MRATSGPIPGQDRRPDCRGAGGGRRCAGATADRDSVRHDRSPGAPERRVHQDPGIWSRGRSTMIL